MVEDTQVESFRLNSFKVKWLNNKSETSGKPKVYFVDKGLDIIMSADKTEKLKRVFSLLLFGYAGAFIVFFSFYLFVLIPIELVYMMGSLGVICICISLYGLMREIKTWRRINGT